MENVKARKSALRLAALLLGTVASAGFNPAVANGIGENGSWQFQTTQDKVNKGIIVDLIERKKNGFYGAMNQTINNTTNIDKQFNCSVSALTTGNTGSNSNAASTSSPNPSNSTSTSAGTTANTASNSNTQSGLLGVLGTGNPNPANGSVDNAQSNSGTLSSGVSGSTTSGTIGAISAGGGRSDQALNSNQSNSGTLTAGITGSTACVGPLNSQ